jgi:hypothetical protein
VSRRPGLGRGAIVSWLALVTTVHGARSTEPGPVAVRFVEGSVHGFLALRTMDGAPLAAGDLLQHVEDSIVETRMVFHFYDGSLYDETVTFTQQSAFLMRQYHLVQRGPAFPDDTEAWLEHASGHYRVHTTSHKNGRVQAFEGRLDLPADVYNGMVITIAKNVPARQSATVHMVAFTPKPRLIGLELKPVGEEQVLIGRQAEPVVHYAFKPQLGMFLRLFATLAGRAPPDNHGWFVIDPVPAFVRFAYSSSPAPTGANTIALVGRSQDQVARSAHGSGRADTRDLAGDPAGAWLESGRDALLQEGRGGETARVVTAVAHAPK